jgi:acyl carrier protein
MPSREEIVQKVTDVMVDTLAVEPEKVTMDAVLKKDLGAESIDFLDIPWKLEKAFNIKIPREELFPEGLASDPTFVKDGALTPEGLAALKSRLPFVDTSEFEEDPKVSAIPDLFTVGTIVRYIETKVGA